MLRGSPSALVALLDDHRYAEALAMARESSAAFGSHLTFGSPEDERRRPMPPTDNQSRPLIVGALILIPALVTSLIEGDPDCNIVVKLTQPSASSNRPEIALNSLSTFLAVEQPDGNCPVAAQFLEALAQKEAAEQAATDAAKTAGDAVPPANTAVIDPNAQPRAPGADQSADNPNAGQTGAPAPVTAEPPATVGTGDNIAVTPVVSSSSPAPGTGATDADQSKTGNPAPTQAVADSIVFDKQARVDLDAILQRIKGAPKSRNRAIAIKAIEDAIMRFGMDLKELGSPNPYPNSRDVSNTIVDPTADGLTL